MSGGTITAPDGVPDVARGSHPRLRVLMVGNMYPPQHAGGYELMWQAAVRHTRSLGHEVRVLVSDYRATAGGEEDDPDVHRTLRWYWDLERYEFPRLSPLERLRLERHNAAVLRSHLEAFRPDLVAWWSMGCMSLALIERVKRAGIPAIFIVHDDWIVYGRHYDQWIRMWRGKRRALAPIAERVFKVPTQVALNDAGPFVFNSRYTLERAFQAGLSASEVTVVNPGIDDQFLEMLPAEPWRWRLVYVGRIDRQKGVDTSVKALAHLPPHATLAIWGTGDDAYVAEMIQLARSLGITDRVSFQGWANPDELRSVYADADAVIFPVRWEEPFGLVPLEAMGLGRPVVTTARGGTAEFVRDGENALVFDAGDHAGLAQLIQRLADDGQLREHLRQGGGRTAANYKIDRFARETVEAITRAAEHPAIQSGREGGAEQIAGARK